VTRFLAALSVLVLALAFTACGGDTETTATTVEEPPIGSTAWGADGCLYTYSGGGSYSPTETCRRQENTGSIAYFNRSDPTTVLYYEYNGYLYKDYNGLNGRQPVGGGGLEEVEYRGQWMSLASYAGVVAEEQAAASAQEEHEVMEAQKLQIEQEFQETQNRIMDRILAPACNSSYNGCA
jgi:hypothetical protein